MALDSDPSREEGNQLEGQFSQLLEQLSETGLSRRDMLKLMGYILVLLFSASRFEVAEAQAEEPYAEWMAENNLSEEERALFLETIGYRRQINLGGIPTELLDLSGLDGMPGNPAEFDMQGRENYPRTAALIEHMRKQALNGDPRGLIRGSRIDSTRTGSYAFDTSDRTLILMESVDSDDLAGVTQVLVHEVAHGLDPNLMLEKPFTRAEWFELVAAKYQMLSSLYELKPDFSNYFFETLESASMEFSHRVLSEYMAIQNGEEPQLNLTENDIAAIESAIAEVRDMPFFVIRNQGEQTPLSEIEVTQLQLNKRMSSEIGRFLMNQIVQDTALADDQNPDQLSQVLHEVYLAHTDGAFSEAFAEMVRHALTDPRQVAPFLEQDYGACSDIPETTNPASLQALVKRCFIQRNPADAVRKGVVRLLKLVGGVAEDAASTDRHRSSVIGSLRLAKLPDDITEITSDASSMPEQSSDELASEEPEAAPSIPELPQELQQSISDSNWQTVQRYHAALIKVDATYPSLYESDPYLMHLDTEFDPWLDLRQIRDIERAMRSSLLYSVMNSPESVDYEELSLAADTLEAFIASDAFVSHVEYRSE